jgi:hypothetical protein
MDVNLTTIRSVLKENRSELLTRSNLVATGIGYKVTKGEKSPTLSIVCSVTKKLPASSLSARDRVPTTVNNIPTDVVETGPIRALQSHTAKYRPAPGGVSIGHRDITAGTLGCLVKKGGQIFILSNNHVLANSNEANPGDPILQPGPYDGGRYPEDHIANLQQFVPISFDEQTSQCSLTRGLASFYNGIVRLFGGADLLKAVRIRAEENKVDAAIARPLNDQDVRSEILEIGMVKGLTQGELGMAIKKSGRTSGLTTGEIQQVDVTVNVQYGAGRIARFSDQLLAGPMSQGGDSGSAVLDNSNNLVGLLFAGSDNSTIINRIENVFSALELSL